MSEPTKMLAEITDIGFRVAMGKMQEIAVEEAGLRGILADLDCQLATVHDDETLRVQRAIGADLLWQQWVGRQRSNLQTQLAMLMVRKADAAEKGRLAFGKSQAAEQLHAEFRAADKDRKAARRNVEEQGWLILKEQTARPV